ncbi:hypothetical protein ACWESM_18535 [Nocardia sp. NPDC003999]
MPAPMPSEDEIRAMARELGLADDTGRYRQSDRGRIAAAVRAAKAAEVDRAELDAAQRQAESLLAAALAELPHLVARVYSDLTDRGVDPAATGPLLAEVGRYVLEVQGLRLESRQEGTTP